MAKNRKQAYGWEFSLPVAEGLKSGEPTVVGQIPCVLLVDRKSDGSASVQTNGIYELSVVGKNKAGNKKIEIGDIIYIKGGVLGVNNEEGVRFGYALGVVESGATTKISVKIGY